MLTNVLDTTPCSLTCRIWTLQMHSAIKLPLCSVWGEGGGGVKSLCEPSDPFGRRLSPVSVA